jgi:hypothetical protein
LSERKYYSFNPLSKAFLVRVLLLLLAFFPQGQELFRSKRYFFMGKKLLEATSFAGARKKCRIP